MEIIFGFVYKYFLDALIIFAVGAATKVLITYFGNDRAAKIKAAILVSMLWAEEQFGIGTGEQKWTTAWNKLVEILEKQRIKIGPKDIALVTDQMKATVPQINALVYNTLPEKAKIVRELRLRTPEVDALIKDLKKKHPEG